MKATLITRTAKLAEQLRRDAEAESVGVEKTLQRKPGERLESLLAQVEGDILIFESSPEVLASDLPAIEKLTRMQPALAILMLAPQQDAGSLLAAMRAGVREVLPAAPDPAEFAAALRRVAQRAAPAHPALRGHVIAFVACKGGSGATFIATNLAYLLATEHKKKTALLDLDLQYGDAAYYVSDGHARASLADIARQVDRLDASLLDASMIAVEPNFKLLAAPEEPEAALGITSYQLERVLEVAQANYDFVVLDVERMLDPLSILALDKSQTIHLVTENMIPHARDAKRLVRILRALGYGDEKLRLIVNKSDRRGGIALEQLEQAIGLKAAHQLRDSDADVGEAVNSGAPLVSLHPNNTVARELRQIARELVEGHAARGWLGRLIGQEA